MSSAWTPKKRKVFEESFYQFLSHCYINSKDLGGHTCLGDHIYDAQRVFLSGVFDGLERDIHDFYVLKSRQLGLSTISRALSVFYLGVHEGLQGASVLDTDKNKNSARREIESMIDNLPSSVKFPRIKTRNRDGLVLENEASMGILAAGVKSSKSSGVLGRSTGLSMAWCSEVCSWDSNEGVEAFRHSLSEINPDRFYIWESTARGFNLWNELWKEARDDESHKRCIFLGWYLKESQVIKRSDPDFERYGVQPPTDREVKKIKEVKDLYNYAITSEQLAWVRKKMDPTAKAEGDAPAEYEGNTLRLQEQPWTEDDAFQQTGSNFFDPVNLTNITIKYVNKNYKTYSYSYGTEFIYCKIYPAPNAKSVELRVWHPPEEGGVYIVASDVAFGANEKNDRSAIQVLRAYADGLDQVAEYASPLINSRQFAWVIASLLAWYAGDKNDVYNILELNGPGEATWNELQRLKIDLQFGQGVKDADERGLRQILTNVRNYIYTRSDSMSAGRNMQWRTTPRLKVTILERLRDFVSNEMLWVRSADTVDEMRSMVRSGEDGDSIEAQGRKKDDRVLALAFGVRCWEERVRKIMAAERRTRENEAARKRMTVRDQYSLYNDNMLQNLFAVKRRERGREALALSRRAWRGR